MFQNFKTVWKGLGTSHSAAAAVEPISAQARIYHYVYDGEQEQSRVHLRLDPDGHGTLIVNANRVMHLNPTAALMAYLILEKSGEA